jgi:heterodisulfide reductase subunit A-like polyferredoxin
METHLPHRSSKSPRGHETSDADVRQIVLIGGGLALTLAAVGLAVYGIFQYLSAHPVSIQSNPMAVYDSQIPPQPRIQEHPAVQIQQLHAYEDQALSTYGWVDKKEGIVRIPIDRAMELQLQRGFPVRQEATKK